MLKPKKVPGRKFTLRDLQEEIDSLLERVSSLEKLHEVTHPLEPVPAVEVDNA